MKRTLIIVGYLIFIGLLWQTKAQTTVNKNLNFELGNFTNWVGYTWYYSSEATSINTSPVKGIVSRRQTIMSDTSAYDSHTGSKLRKIPKGYMYSARLGDEIIDGTDSKPRGWEQSLRYTLKVDSSNALLIMKFALVLQYASDHTALMEPRFKVTLYDKSGDVIPDCANYDVYASSGSVSGFNTYTESSSSSGQGGGSSTSVVRWRDWTAVGVNLLSYLGQTITIEFMSADCTGQYHFGYAYFIAETHPLYITVKYCSGDSEASLTAPSGFQSYKWTNADGVQVDTARILKLASPVEGATYTCTMYSATGCVVSLTSVIAKYMPKADFSSYMYDCFSNTVQIVNQSTKTHGTLTYSWDFGDSITSTEENPKVQYKTSGLHKARLALANLPSTCVDTLIKYVESFSPPLVGIKGDTTYCPNLTTFLKGYGAYNYSWSTGVTADSIEIGAPGGRYWMLGHSSTGCVSDTLYRNVSEEPDWAFAVNNDSSLCDGRTLTLTATGAQEYSWNTGDTVSSIIVTKTGTYIGTGTNKRGCKKSETRNVTAHAVPAVNFAMSTSSINSKHNELLCSIASETGINYLWDMGDGSTFSGSAVEHAYAVSKDILGYTVTLVASTQFNCADTLSRDLDVVPFVPNIFSPNGDGINDLVGVDIDLEVFDRNGFVLYKGNTGWDGKYNGHLVQPDTYFYLVTYRDIRGKAHDKKGFITLVK